MSIEDEENDKVGVIRYNERDDHVKPWHRTDQCAVSSQLDSGLTLCVGKFLCKGLSN